MLVQCVAGKYFKTYELHNYTPNPLQLCISNLHTHALNKTETRLCGDCWN